MHILEPVTIDDAAKENFLKRLREFGYNETECAKRFSVSAMVSANLFKSPESPKPNETSDELGSLITFFLFGRKMNIEMADKLFLPEGRASLIAMKLARESEGLLEPLTHLFPFKNLLILTDLKRPNEDINRVMFLWRDSLILAQAVVREPFESALDLGTGSGIHALLAAQHCNHVVGIDNSSRSVVFANFNKWLNGIKNVDFLLGDLYSPLKGKKFDWILANPPYVPSNKNDAEKNYASGGESGEEILSRVMGGLDEHLKADGLAQLVTLFCYRKGEDYQTKLNRWMHGKLNGFDVAILSKDAPTYFELLEKSHAEKFSKFEFGMMTLRRAKSEAGIYLSRQGSLLESRDGQVLSGTLGREIFNRNH